MIGTIQPSATTQPQKTVSHLIRSQFTYIHN